MVCAVVLNVLRSCRVVLSFPNAEFSLYRPLCNLFSPPSSVQCTARVCARAFAISPARQGAVRCLRRTALLHVAVRCALQDVVYTVHRTGVSSVCVCVCVCTVHRTGVSSVCVCVPLPCAQQGKARSVAYGIAARAVRCALQDPGQTPFTYKAGVGGVITGWDKVRISLSLSLPSQCCLVSLPLPLSPPYPHTALSSTARARSLSRAFAPYARTVLSSLLLRHRYGYVPVCMHVCRHVSGVAPVCNSDGKPKRARA